MTLMQATRIKRGKISKKEKNEIKEKIISENSSDEKLRSKIETKRHLQIAKSIVNNTLTTFGIGDSLKGYFTKQ